MVRTLLLVTALMLWATPASASDIPPDNGCRCHAAGHDDAHPGWLFAVAGLGIALALGRRATATG
jgi:MYXO-CTERM domain-containing protein